MKFIVKTILLLAMAFPLAGFAQAPVFDESIAVTGDFLVSPASKELLVLPGESRSFELEITNRTGQRARFVLGAEDLDAKAYSDQDLSDTEPGTLDSLAPYLKASVSDVYLEHGESMILPIVLSLPAYVSEPSLYGLVTVTAGTDKDLPRTATGARILSRIGVPVLVLTSDERSASGKLLSFGTADGRSIYTGKAVPLKISYENDGQVHMRPVGQVTLRNFFGGVSAKVAVEPWYILPGTTRSRVVTVTTENHFGYYAATLTMTAGDEASSVTSVVRFWIIPRSIIFVILVALVAIVLSRRWIRRLRAVDEEKL